MKKLLALSLSALLLLGLTACGKSGSTSSDTAGTSASSDTALTSSEITSSAKNTDKLTSLSEKKGYWHLATLSGDEMYVIRIWVNGSEGDLAYMIGKEYNSFDKDYIAQNPDNATETIDGVKYYFDAGDGCYLSCSESDGSVKFNAEEYEAEFTLTRTGEDSMKVTTAVNIPPCLSTIEVGRVLDFVAE